MSAAKPPPGFTADEWALVERSIADGTIPTSPEEPSTSGAPKVRPAITGETTLRELEEIMRAHQCEKLEGTPIGRVSRPSHYCAAWTICGDEGKGETLAEALAAGLRAYRIEDAEELDLTDEEARS